MSLKSIRESYSKLLTTFNNAGVKLNESQKSDVDNFIIALESTMSKQRESAIRKTKKAVSEKYEKQIAKVFESIIKNVQDNNVLASKIETLAARLNERKNLALKVDEYLDLYIEKILPSKTIVDYDRLQKLEESQQRLKNMLVLDEEAIECKKAELEESYKTQKSKCETEVAKLQVKLQESQKKAKEFEKKIESLKSIELLESKTKHLPSFEATAVKKRLAKSSADVIEKKFDSVLESVKDDVKKLAEQDDVETTLECEINKIIHEDDVKENDILKNKPHNNHVAECDTDNMAETDQIKNDIEENDVEEFETMESVKCDENGDIQLDESDIIDADLLKFWATRSLEVS